MGIKHRQRQGNTNVRISTAASKCRLRHRYSVRVLCRCTAKENAEALVVATKEIGQEVNADKTKFMVMSRDRNAGRAGSQCED